MKPLYKRVGVPYKRFHCYRHTFATKLSARGVPIQVTSALLGHADIRETAKYYVKISHGEKRSAIEKINITDQQADDNKEYYI